MAHTKMLSTFLRTMTENGYSINTGVKILKVLPHDEKRKQALESATEIIKASKTEQEALERIQARFGEPNEIPNCKHEI